MCLSFWSVGFVSLLNKVEREREEVESGVSAHHYHTEIRFSVITGSL